MWWIICPFTKCDLLPIAFFGYDTTGKFHGWVNTMGWFHLQYHGWMNTMGGCHLQYHGWMNTMGECHLPFRSLKVKIILLLKYVKNYLWILLSYKMCLFQLKIFKSIQILFLIRMIGGVNKLLFLHLRMVLNFRT